MPRKSRKPIPRLPHIVDGSKIKPVPLPDDDDFETALAKADYVQRLNDIRDLDIASDRYLLDMEEPDSGDDD